MRTWVVVGLCVVIAALLGVAGCSKSVPEGNRGAEAAEKATPAPEPAAPAGQFPTAEVTSTATAPEIDGNLDDAAWKDKQLKGAMLNVYTSEVAAVQSKVYVTYDDKNLYVAFDMSEPNVAGMVARQTDVVADRDGPIWEDDAGEIFLDPANGQKERNYYHIAVNSKCVVYDEKIKDNKWDAPARCAAKVGTDHWVVELSIPLASLGVEGSPKGQTWLANFCRDRQVTGTTEDTSWSDVGEEFHNWQRYGHITFR